MNRKETCNGGAKPQYMHFDRTMSIPKGTTYIHIKIGIKERNKKSFPVIETYIVVQNNPWLPVSHMTYNNSYLNGCFSGKVASFPCPDCPLALPANLPEAGVRGSSGGMWRSMSGADGKVYVQLHDEQLRVSAEVYVGQCASPRPPRMLLHQVHRRMITRTINHTHTITATNRLKECPVSTEYISQQMFIWFTRVEVVVSIISPPVVRVQAGQHYWWNSWRNHFAVWLGDCWP